MNCFGLFRCENFFFAHGAFERFYIMKDNTVKFKIEFYLDVFYAASWTDYGASF